jgi:hypothetical protein
MISSSILDLYLITSLWKGPPNSSQSSKKQ